MAETLSPYRGKLQLRSADGKKVEIYALNDFRNCIKRADEYALDRRSPTRVDGLWFHRNAGSLRVLDEATRELVTFDGYPYTQTGGCGPKLFPLPAFEIRGYEEVFTEHQAFFIELDSALRDHPGGWLSSPVGWGVRVAERLSIRHIIEVDLVRGTLRLGFEKVPVDFQPMLPGMIGI